MKIGLLIANTTHNRQRSSWGGISEHIAQTLEKHGGEVSVIAPSATKVRAARLLGKIVHHLARVFLKKQYLYNHTFLLARTSARAAAQQLAKRSVDVIVAPCGATEMALLPTAIPIVLIEDANIASLHQYYAGYSNLLRSSFRQTDELERLAIGKARLVLQPSQWAARRTIERYHADAHKVHVVPFGANIAAPPLLRSFAGKGDRIGAAYSFWGSIGKERVEILPWKRWRSWKSKGFRRNSWCVAALLPTPGLILE